MIKHRITVLLLICILVCNIEIINAKAINELNTEEIAGMLSVDVKYINALHEIYGNDNLINISYDIVSLMSQRYNYNRGAAKVYFDNLNELARMDIIFYEALLLYNNCSVNNINKLIINYESILENYFSIANEFNTNFGINIVYCISNYIDVFNTNELLLLSKAFSIDSCINGDYNIEDIYTEFLIPFRLNEMSIENLMLSGTSLIGKVRYIWGGGHGITYHMDGINPYWFQWDKYYDNLDTCIKPSGSYCIIHGESQGLCTENEWLYSVEEYINKRNGIYTINDKYTSVLNDLPLYNGIPEHNFDGLDCSGYVSWVYAQLSDKHYIESSAYDISKVQFFYEVPLGEQMICGDVFAWASHVVLIVGKVDKDGRVYVTLEQTPNSVKFGVLHYADASYNSIVKAKNIASEANVVFGNITNENPHTYCIDNVKYYIPELAEGEEPMVDENGQPIYSEFAFIGRCVDKFTDDNTKLKDKYAVDIIQHTINNTLITYLDGYNNYDGNIFTFENVDIAYKINESFE